MSFVVNDQRILPQKSCVQRFTLETHAVAAEEKPRADHVYRAADHCFARRIGGPFAVVGELAAEGTDTEIRIKLLIPLNLECCLIDYGSAVDDVNESPGNCRFCLPCEKPNGNDGGLPKSRRNIAPFRYRLSACLHQAEQINLPGKR